MKPLQISKKKTPDSSKLATPASVRASMEFKPMKASSRSRSVDLKPLSKVMSQTLDFRALGLDTIEQSRFAFTEELEEEQVEPDEPIPIQRAISPPPVEPTQPLLIGQKQALCFDDLENIRIIESRIPPKQRYIISKT
jgi:hypothetical protein